MTGVTPGSKGMAIISCLVYDILLLSPNSTFVVEEQTDYVSAMTPFQLCR